MTYAWDRRKATANLQKHGVDFADAVTALEDDRALSMRDPYSSDEDRFIALGMDALGRIVLVAYTYRDDGIRIISARKAEPRERRQYEEQP